jgi:hypothetical protein
MINGNVICMGQTRNECKTLFRTAEGRRPLGQPRAKREDNTKM